MKTSDLIDQALDWAVAKCEGYECQFDDKSCGPWLVPEEGYLHNEKPLSCFLPSTKWAQGGPIIGREGIAIDCARTCGEIDSWIAATENLREDEEDEYSRPVEFSGPTPLIAAMRCYVASKLGDEVDIPKELLGEQ